MVAWRSVNVCVLTNWWLLCGEQQQPPSWLQLLCCLAVKTSSHKESHVRSKLGFSATAESSEVVKCSDPTVSWLFRADIFTARPQLTASVFILCLFLSSKCPDDLSPRACLWSSDGLYLLKKSASSPLSPHASSGWDNTILSKYKNWLWGFNLISLKTIYNLFVFIEYLFNQKDSWGFALLLLPQQMTAEEMTLSTDCRRSGATCSKPWSPVCSVPS